jgi:hypothetical protein
LFITTAEPSIAIKHETFFLLEDKPSTLRKGLFGIAKSNDHFSFLIFLDFSAAFVTIDHSLLETIYLGICDIISVWFSS